MQRSYFSWRLSDLEHEESQKNNWVAVPDIGNSHEHRYLDNSIQGDVQQ